MKLYVIYALLSSLLATSTIGLWRFSKLTRPYMYLLIQILIAFLVEIAGRIVRTDNAVIYNSYILQEVIWISLAARLWLNGRIFRNLTLAGLAICITIWYANIYSIQMETAFANKAFLSNCILITALYTGIMLQTASQTKNILRHPLFWLCLAHILYFGCVIPYYSMYDYFTYKNQELGRQLSVINDVLATLRYALVGYVFWLQGRDQETQSVLTILKVGKQKSR